jgi:NTE family protein
LTALLTGGLGKHNPIALLNRKPLRKLLKKYMPCEKIQASIDAGVLHAISITASGYTSGQSVSFFQGVESLEFWARARRLGCPEIITLDHLMASSAIPLFFKAEKIRREYFGDGSMRQTAPISPALHLGAERILVIGVRQDDRYKPEREKTEGYPNLAQIAGHVLDSIFLDNMEVDLERLTRINNTVEHVANRHIRRGNVALKPVDVLTISPSKDIGKIALRHAHRLPRPVRLLLRGIGAFGSSSSSLASYLLFEKEYTRELISLGFKDAMKRKEEVLAFLNQENQ